MPDDQTNLVVPETSPVRSAILTVIKQVAEEQNRMLVALDDNVPLLESGLDSLCFAVIVARLEDVLGVDPFTSSSDAPFPVTIADFIKTYEDAAR